MAKNSKNKYSATVLLPQTDFPMRAGLVQKEPLILDFWKKLDLYQAMLKKNEAGRHFILHDGPPYANGKIHIGHALDKTIKDIMLKSRALMGCYTPYVPGWDCHGLPIEQALAAANSFSRAGVMRNPATGTAPWPPGGR